MLTVDPAVYLESFSPVAYVLVFFAGALVSFTPCVLPILPIIVGYIGGMTENSPKKKFRISIFYVLGMAITFSSLGLLAALTGKLFGQIQNNPLAYLAVGVVLILLGLSSLDVFHLSLFSFSSRLKFSGLGALGMGMTSGLISSPCLSPVLGGLLILVASGQNVLYGATLLFVFSLGMGTVLLLAGFFAGFISGLAKSPAVMKTVKTFFGFFMIFLGCFFVFRGITLFGG